MWIVETYTICDGWVNCWSEEDEDGRRPLTFITAEEAFEETMDHIHNMIDANMEVDPRDYRLREIS